MTPGSRTSVGYERGAMESVERGVDDRADPIPRFLATIENGLIQVEGTVSAFVAGDGFALVGQLKFLLPDDTITSDDAQRQVREVQYSDNLFKRLRNAPTLLSVGVDEFTHSQARLLDHDPLQYLARPGRKTH
jgi:hypothetical protein